MRCVSVSSKQLENVLVGNKNHYADEDKKANGVYHPLSLWRNRFSSYKLVQGKGSPAPIKRRKRNEVDEA